MTLPPGTSPPRPFRLTMAAKRRVASTDRRVSAPKPSITGKRPSSRPPSPGVIGRMCKWAAQRSASPAVMRMELGDHKVATPVTTDMDSRVAALEQQRTADHEYFGQLAAALQVLDAAPFQPLFRAVVPI